jgi:hypothetical protein
MRRETCIMLYKGGEAGALFRRRRALVRREHQIRAGCVLVTLEAGIDRRRHLDRAAILR